MTYILFKMLFCQTYLSELLNFKFYAAKWFYVYFKRICATPNDLVSFLSISLKIIIFEDWRTVLVHIRFVESSFGWLLKRNLKCNFFQTVLKQNKVIKFSDAAGKNVVLITRWNAVVWVKLHWEPVLETYALFAVERHYGLIMSRCCGIVVSRSGSVV